MASVLGVLTPLAVSWAFAEAKRPVLAAVTPNVPLAPMAVDSPATIEVLSRAVGILDGNRVGLTLTELRVALAEPTDAVQRAIAVGLREKQLRRLGSRNTLRYVGNG